MATGSQKCELTTRHTMEVQHTCRSSYGPVLWNDCLWSSMLARATVHQVFGSERDQNFVDVAMPLAQRHIPDRF